MSLKWCIIFIYAWLIVWQKGVTYSVFCFKCYKCCYKWYVKDGINRQSKSFPWLHDVLVEASSIWTERCAMSSDRSLKGRAWTLYWNLQGEGNPEIWTRRQIGLEFRKWEQSKEVVMLFQITNNRPSLF